MLEWFNQHVGSISVYEGASKLPKDDIRRLALLNPYSAKILLQSENRPLIAQYYPLLEELCVLRRTTASRVPRDQAGKHFYNLRDLIKPHHMLTRHVERTADEEADFQWLHRDAAK